MKICILSLLPLLSFVLCTPSLQRPLAADLPPSTSNRKSLLDLHKSLIEIESVSGNEHAVGIYLSEYLRSIDFNVEEQIVPPLKSNPKNATRFNILAYPGPSRQTPVLVTSHIDTVPPFFNYSIRGDDNTEIWGRGSNDDKGAVAAQITAITDLLDSSAISSNDVALLLVVGEEVGGDGMRAANDLGLGWEAVVFGEPTELKLVSGHKGMLSFEVTAKGRAAHSGYPWLGESAISMLVPALAKILALELPESDDIGNSTINIGTISGGVATNVVAEGASAKVAVRIGGGTLEDIMNTIRKAIAEVDERLEVEISPGYEPVRCDTDVEGFDTITVNYGTDVPLLKGKHKRYLYGPGNIFTAHSDHEFVTVEDLGEAVDGYKRLILGAL